MDVEGVWYVQDSDSHVARLSHGNDSVWGSRGDQRPDYHGLHKPSQVLDSLEVSENCGGV